MLRILGTCSYIKFARKAYSYCFRDIFVSIARYSYWWQCIYSDRKTFVIFFFTFAKDSQEIRQTDRKLRKKFAGIRKKFGSIRNHLKGLTFSVILLGNRIISGEFAANIIFFTFARIFATLESSIIFATPHERPRMLTNGIPYENLRLLRMSGDQFAIIANWWRITFQVNSPCWPRI